MLGLSSSCDATVRLTRKASIPEKPGDVKEFDKGKRWNAVLPGGKSDDTMFLPVGKSDAPCGAMSAFGTLRFICHYEALSFHSVQRTLSLRSTVLRCCGNLPEGTPCKSDVPMARCCLRSDVAFGAMCAFGTLRRGTCTFPLFSTYTVFTLEA